VPLCAGGRLLFATAVGIEAPRRAAGTATVHTHHAVQGVRAGFGRMVALPYDTVHPVYIYQVHYENRRLHF
jgi:hypothetical protein